MSKAKGIWDVTVPAWAAGGVRVLRSLDASDAEAGQASHDGKYLGVNVVQIAKRYINANEAKRPALARLFDASLGLHDYAAGLGQEARQFTKPLELAMLESVSAFIEGREPDLDNVAGFGANYIAPEFSAYMEEIAEGTPSSAGGGWMVYWSDLLSDCRFDLFVRTGLLTNSDGAATACVFH